MSKPTVHHIKREEYDVYIGRANGSLPRSKWANPWIIGKDGTREEVISRYESWIKTQPDLMAALPELKGKRLGCWCSPAHCHGDVLARMVEELEPTREDRVEAALQADAKAISDHIIEGAAQTLVGQVRSQQEILPVFSSHYSLGSSILTLEEAGKTDPGNPVSICDIAKANGLKQVILVDERIDGFLEAYKNIQKAGIAQLVYGLKLVVASDMADKTPTAKRSDSNIIVFLKNTDAYSDVIRIWNRAWTEGYYVPPRETGYGRIDWKTLKSLWTPNLTLALPWASSFLARNTMTFASIVPDLPVRTNEVTLFKEIDSGLPFADLIDAAINRFATDTGAQIQPSKSIYYLDAAAFDTYVTYRAIMNHGSFSAPNVSHLCSDRFSFAEWQRLNKETQS